jgi:hypothetical protein
VTRNRTPFAAATLALLLAAIALSARAAHAQPQPPASFFGSASIDGKPVPDGTRIRGYINGKDCTQPSERTGTLTDGGVSAYAIAVMHESQEPGCATIGVAVRFTIGGQPANEGATWKPGPLRLDLNAGSGSAPPLPTPTPTAVGGASPGANASAVTPATRPTGALPTDDVTFGRTPGSAPAPASDSGGSSTILVVLIAAAVLAIAGGAIGFALSRRR